MKPSSLATIILRFIVIYFLLSGLLAGLGPAFVSIAFTQPSSTALGLAPFQSRGPFSGLASLQLILAAISIVAAIILWIWSRPLGRVIARGLEEE